MHGDISTERMLEKMRSSIDTHLEKNLFATDEAEVAANVEKTVASYLRSLESVRSIGFSVKSYSVPEQRPEIVSTKHGTYLHFYIKDVEGASSTRIIKRRTSIRLARRYFKRHVRSKVYTDCIVRPTVPIQFITVTMKLTKEGAVFETPDA
jgi:hypothetical protein